MGAQTSALHEVISAFDEADRKPSPTGSDDLDYEDRPKAPGADSGEGADGADDMDGEEEDEEEHGGGGVDDATEEDGEESEEAEEGEIEEVNEEESESTHIPNLHRSVHRKYDFGLKKAVPVWFFGFKTTFDSWEAFH